MKYKNCDMYCHQVIKYVNCRAFLPLSSGTKMVKIEQDTPEL